MIRQRFYEISEIDHLFQYPLSEHKLALLGRVCALRQGMRHLDLACGKGELLARWARDYSVLGVGVDHSPAFIEAAKQRAYEYEVPDHLQFTVDEVAEYPQPYHQFDVVSCIGASWIGGGTLGTLELMQTALKDQEGLLLLGEGFWNEPPSDDVCAAMGIDPATFGTLGETLERFESLDLELVEMVLASEEDRDRYESQHWLAVDRWRRENRNDPDVRALQQWNAENRRIYLQHGRRYLGWGVFVLRVRF